MILTYLSKLSVLLIQVTVACATMEKKLFQNECLSSLHPSLSKLSLFSPFHHSSPVKPLYTSRPEQCSYSYSLSALWSIKVVVVLHVCTLKIYCCPLIFQILM